MRVSRCLNVFFIPPMRTAGMDEKTLRDIPISKLTEMVESGEIPSHECRTFAEYIRWVES